MSKRRTAGISKVIGKRRWAEADARNVVSSWQRSGKRVSEFARECVFRGIVNADSSRR